MYGTFPYGTDPFGDVPIGGTTAYPLTLEVTRAVVELIGKNDQQSTDVTRLVVEVIGDDPFVLTEPTQLVTRLATEVIHSLAQAAGKRTVVSRAVLEVVAAATYLGKGLVTPVVSVYQPDILLAFESAWTAGRWHYSDGAGHGLFVEGDGSTLTIRYTDGTRTASATAANTGGIRILALSASTSAATARIWLDGTALTVTPTGTDWDTIDLTSLSVEHEAILPDSLAVMELMVHLGGLSDARLAYLRQYLTCKWVTPGCNVHTDLPPAP